MEKRGTFEFSILICREHTATLLQDSSKHSVMLIISLVDYSFLIPEVVNYHQQTPAQENRPLLRRIKGLCAVNQRAERSPVNSTSTVDDKH